MLNPMIFPMIKNNIKILLACFLLCLSTVIHAERPAASGISGLPYDNRSDSIDIIHSTLRVSMPRFSSHVIQAHSTLECKSKTNGLSKMRIDLTGLTVDSIKTNHLSTSFVVEGQSLALTLPNVYNNNDSLYFDFYYHGTPIQNAGDWGGFYWDATYAYNIGVSFLETQHSYGRTWFPCLDNFVEKGTYEYFITTDTLKKAFCGGLLMGSTRQDSTVTWHWKDNTPVSSYLASMTVSDYATLSSTYAGLTRSIPIQLAARAVDTSNLKASFIHLPDAIGAFESSYGPYQFDRVGYCLTPFSAGAMEHDCNITYMKALVDGSINYETTMAHELSHHWFGDLVTCDNAGDMWLNEGWASYSENIFLEHLYGKTSYQNSVRTNHDAVLHLVHVKDSSYYALSNIPTEYTYGRTVYQKGADVAHTLRGYMGDTMFFRVLKDYMNDMKYKNVSSAMFRDYIKAHSSFNPDAFFDNWVFAPGFPHFSMDVTKTSANAGGYQTEIWIRQKLKHAPAYYTNVPLEIAAFDANFNKQVFKTEVNGLCNTATIQTSFVPVYIALDFDEKLSDAITDEYKIMKLTGVYNFTTLKASVDVKAVSDSVLFRIEHNWVAPDPMKNKVDGIILSNERYWTFDGIFDSTFRANVTVNYNGSNDPNQGYYDNSFINVREDSLLMVYRKDATEDWRFCDSCYINVLGNVNDKIGKFVIRSVQKGQYALAKHDFIHPDTSYCTKNCNELGIEDVKKNDLFIIYPNPTKDYFVIESKSINGSVDCSIFNENGQLILNKSFTSSSAITINCEKWSAGTYFIQLKDKKGNGLGVSKLVIH